MHDPTFLAIEGHTDPTHAADHTLTRSAARRKLVERFASDLEGLMSDYGLSDAEKKALREVDLRKLADLGLHPYFLPQVSRLFKGTGYNHNESAAAQLYASKMLNGETPGGKTPGKA